MSRAVAALGDSALLLPASGLLFAYLIATRQVKLALGFAGALGLVGAATLALKLAFHACGHTVQDLDVLSPSGHASFAAIFYGALAILVSAGRSRGARAAIRSAAAAVVLLIAASRIRTQAHTVEEVAIGLAVGLAGLALFAWWHGRLGRPRISPAPLLAGFALALAVLGGSHLSLEGQIGKTARRLSAAFEICEEPQQRWHPRYGTRPERRGLPAGAS